MFLLSKFLCFGVFGDILSLVVVGLGLVWLECFVECVYEILFYVIVEGCIVVGSKLFFENDLVMLFEVLWLVVW